MRIMIPRGAVGAETVAFGGVDLGFVGGGGGASASVVAVAVTFAPASAVAIVALGGGAAAGGTGRGGGGLGLRGFFSSSFETRRRCLSRGGLLVVAPSVVCISAGHLGRTGGLSVGHLGIAAVSIFWIAEET